MFANIEDSEFLRELVCQYFCDGMNPSEIAAQVKKDTGIEINQKVPYRILQHESAKFKYVSARHNPVTEALVDTFSTPAWKPNFTVTLTDVRNELVRRTAHLIWEIIQERIVVQKKRIITIGFSGGHTMKRVARRLRFILSEPRDTQISPEIVFSALVSGIDHEAAGTDPTSFFTYLSGRGDGETGEMPGFKMRFELLHAPPLIRPSEWERLLSRETSDHPTISYSLRKAGSFDLIVTSASQFDDPHCQMHRCYELYSKETLQQLEADGCVGDMLWQPLNHNGAIDTRNHAFRTVSLVNLNDLPNLIGRGTRVLLALGPCATPDRCPRLRTRTLSTILRHRLVTDVVVDRRTAAELLQLNLPRSET